MLFDFLLLIPFGEIKMNIICLPLLTYRIDFPKNSIMSNACNGITLECQLYVPCQLMYVHSAFCGGLIHTVQVAKRQYR